LTLFKNHELFREVSCKDLSPQYAAVYLRRPYENTPLVLLIRWMCRLRRRRSNGQILSNISHMAYFLPAILTQKETFIF